MSYNFLFNRNKAVKEEWQMWLLRGTIISSLLT